MRLVDFGLDGEVITVKSLRPSEVDIDSTGQVEEVDVYEYNADSKIETSRYFRLDIQRAPVMEVQKFIKGSTNWIFFSVPVDPQHTDPRYNLADDIGSDSSPFKLYQYDAGFNGFRIYPLDTGQVALQSGHAYFTRVTKDVEIDVGGTTNQDQKRLPLKSAGWHAIGNPFPIDINISDLKIIKTTDPTTSFSFNQAVTDNLIEPTLYSWKTEPGTDDHYSSNDQQLKPWYGYWIRTLQANLNLIIPAPSTIVDYTASPPDQFITSMVGEAPAKTQTPEILTQGFELEFSLVSDTSADITTRLGTHQEARVGWDQMDQSEPPRLKHMASAYFDHLDWVDTSHNQEQAKLVGKVQNRRPNSIHYNSDFQPLLQIGESRKWDLYTYIDRQAKMQLSWASSINNLPDDTMLYIRLKPSINTPSIIKYDGNLAISNSEVEVDGWQDMRKVQNISITANQRINTDIFEIRAEKFQMVPPTDLEVVAGEAEVKLFWTLEDNSFIDSITVNRQIVSRLDQSADSSGVKGTGKPTTYYLGFDQREFVDSQVEEEETYRYQIGVQFKSGALLHSRLTETTVLPKIYATRLMANYPNPFNPETWFPYELDHETDVVIEIHNSNGMLVRRLTFGRQRRGRYQRKNQAAYWDGRTESGELVASGIYFYTLIAGGFSDTRKMVILK